MSVRRIAARFASNFSNRRTSFVYYLAGENSGKFFNFCGKFYFLHFKFHSANLVISPIDVVPENNL